MKQIKGIYKIQDVEEIIHYLERAQEIYRKIYTNEDGIYSTLGNMGAYDAITEVLNFIKGRIPNNEEEYKLIMNDDYV